MATVYRNTKNSKAVKWVCGVALSLAIICLALYLFLPSGSGYRQLLYEAYFLLALSAVLGGGYYLRKYTIDEQADTFTDGQQKKHPLKISRLKTVTYKESKKGGFRSLLLHDDGVGFIEVNTSKENADKMVQQLTKANPAIEVKHETNLL